MVRVPLYAYPNSPYSFFPNASYPYNFYTSPAEAYVDRPHRPSSVASRTSPSVINVPVHDSSPSRASSFSPQPPPVSATPLDPSSAAATIQSHFRGFCVRRHQPLLHLRTIARARKQLEDLQSELARPDFAFKVKASEKERLRLTETVMAIILRLDAIEGSMAEVRSQRKETTKMAIKLQDAIDAIVMQKDENPALDPTGDLAPHDDAVSSEPSQEALHPENGRMVDVQQGEGCAIPANATVDDNSSQEERPSSEDNGADSCVLNSDDINVADMEPLKDGRSSSDCQQTEDLFEQRKSRSDEQLQDALHPEAGVVGIVQAEGCAIPTNIFKDDNTVQDEHLSSEYNGADTCIPNSNVVNIWAAEDESPLHSHGTEDLAVQREGGSGGPESNLRALHAKAICELEKEICPLNGEETLSSEVTCGDIVATTHAAKETVGNGTDASHVGTYEENMQNCFPGIEMGQDACMQDMVHTGDGSAKKESLGGMYRCIDVVQKGISKAEELCPGTSAAEERCIDLPMTGSPSVPQSDAVLHQLPEDIRQLKSLVGKLLVQNKAQSNLLCALAERVEMLEHQQQQNRRHNQMKRRKERSKKGLRRSVKLYNYEEC